MLAPTFTCPVDLVKTLSVNSRFDGGKWLCGLNYIGRRTLKPTTNQDRATSCVVYSFGSNFDISFESYIDSIVNKTSHGTAGCEVHIFDPTLRHSGSERMHPFMKELRRRSSISPPWTLHEVALAGEEGVSTLTISLNLGKNKLANNRGVSTVTYPAATLRSILQGRGGHKQHRCVDVLKVDVEGAESGVLSNTPWRSLCVGLLLLELHVGTIENRERKHFTLGRAVSYIRTLEAAGLHHYSSEPVCDKCHAVELGFVNASWLRNLVGTHEHSLDDDEDTDVDPSSWSASREDGTWNPWPKHGDAYSEQQEMLNSARLVSHDHVTWA